MAKDIFRVDFRPGETTAKCVGGVADGRTMTGRDGVLKAILPSEDGPYVANVPPKSFMTYRQSFYSLRTLTVNMPKYGPISFALWVEADMGDAEVLERLFQCYNPVTHNSRIFP